MKDLDIIKQIEKELNVELKESDHKKGYTLNQNGQVTGLCLKDCKIKNLNLIIYPLKNLKNLTQLVLDKNQLSDISPLKYLDNLTGLYLHNNQIRDISPLKNLGNLTELDLEKNQLSDITPLTDLKELTRLNLYDNL
jgi:internalin A